MSPVYRNGRGHPQGTITKVALGIVREAGADGILQQHLVGRLLETFTEADERTLRRHLTRMTSGRYRGQLERDENDVYRWKGG